jgi:hypothetical protein
VIINVPEKALVIKIKGSLCCIRCSPDTNHTVLFRPSLRHASRSIFLDLGYVRFSPIGEGKVAEKLRLFETDEESVKKATVIGTKEIMPEASSIMEPLNACYALVSRPLL